MNREKHIIVNKDRIKSRVNGHLEHVLVSVDGTDAGELIAVDNGLLVEITTRREGEKEVVNGKLANDASKEIYLVHSPEVMYDPRLDKLSDFFNEAGKVVRAYSLTEGDVYTVTEGAFDGAVAEGDFLVVAEGKLTVGTHTSAKVYFEVIEDMIDHLEDGVQAWALRVHRN